MLSNPLTPSITGVGVDLWLPLNWQTYGQKLQLGSSSKASAILVLFRCSSLFPTLQTASLYLLCASFFSWNSTPAEGEPASTHNLYLHWLAASSRLIYCNHPATFWHKSEPEPGMLDSEADLSSLLNWLLNFLRLHLDEQHFLVTAGNNVVRQLTL